MKLHEGVYENLITGQLQASMNQATDEGLGAIQIRLIDYICSRDVRPMSIDWRMHRPILPPFVSAV